MLAVAGCAVLVVACGGQPPATFVGESDHFRLYVDPALMPLPAAYAGDNALAALETNWADFATMLKMPDRKIAYYWYADQHIADACGDAHVGGCTKEGENVEIDAPTLPDAHELIHAYTYQRSPRRPIPFLAEGIAEAIGCSYELPVAAGLDGDWRASVAAVRSLDVYGNGGRFVRQMIRRHGIDEFLRYYEQSPERRDPALFAANFAAFWGEAIDDVWPAINTIEATIPFNDRKICPCSLPNIPLNADITVDRARTPYWTLPDPGDGTLALTAARYDQVFLRDCSGMDSDLRGKTVLARLGAATNRWFALPTNIVAASVDHYVADDCGEAAHYTLSPDVLVGFPYVTVAIPASEEATVYVAIDVPFPLDSQVSGARAVCDSCSFDEGGCTPISDALEVPVTGSFYARLHFFANDLQVQRQIIDVQSLEFSR